jgi:DNA-directed RNA polymerase subunit RPC12/RpoP
MDGEQKPLPVCPNCGKPMRLVRSVPKIGALPELRTYNCSSCGETVTEADEPQ